MPETYDPNQSAQRATPDTYLTLWVVRLELEIPAYTDSVSISFSEDANTKLDGRNPAIELGEEAVVALFDLSTNTVGEAMQETRAILGGLSSVLDPGEERITGISFRDKRFGLLEFMGVAEAVDALGISKQRIYQLRVSGNFPDPVQKLKATPLWRSSDIRHFDKNRRADR